MESTGRPGKVHISEKTYQFLKEDYYVEEGDEEEGRFIIYTKHPHNFKIHDVTTEYEYFYFYMLSRVCYLICNFCHSLFVPCLGMKTYFITGRKSSSVQILKPDTVNEDLEETINNNMS